MIPQLLAWAGKVLYFTRTRGGDPKRKKQVYWSQKILPAHAGVILIGIPKMFVVFNFTRTRGGDPDAQATVEVAKQFYPHTRG